MGRFSQVLIACDFDNTLVYTEQALLSGGTVPPLSDGNRQAIEYFIAEGGTFCMATGRALPSFLRIAHLVPMNGPAIIANGAGIYDPAAGAMAATAYLPDTVRGHVEELEAQMADLAYEIYHDDDKMFVVRPNDITARHVHLTHLPAVELHGIAEAPSPISKLLFEEDEERMEQLIALLQRQPWYGQYEVVRSGRNLLELTSKGANKGGMLRELARLTGKSLRHTYTAGDHANDIDMLKLSAMGFAPANAIPAVKETPGVHLLPDCRENAIAAMIEELKKRYP